MSVLFPMIFTDSKHGSWKPGFIEKAYICPTLKKLPRLGKLLNWVSYTKLRKLKVLMFMI